jgi:Major Facilitator Superfamily
LLFGMFFFLTIFVQTVWGYSALRTGVAYLPMMAALLVMSAVSAQLIPRIGARPLLLAGSATAAGGMFWLSRISENSHYTTGLLGPTLVAGAGLGMLFLPLSVVALSRVQASAAGAASSLLNTGQQVGGSIGLALLGTVAWTTVANSIRGQAAGGQVPAAVYRHALSAGFSRGFEVSAGIMLLALIITIVAIRVRRADLDGAGRPANS